MDRTEATIRNLLAALPGPGYDLGILSEHGMYRLEAVSQDRFVRLIPYLKYRNANDAHVYLRPTGESAYTLLDDLTESTLRTLTEAGYGPAAVIETSHGSFQAWLRHEQPLYKELGTLAAKSLAARFGADSSAADWRRFGRAPAFTNRKPKYRNASGLFRSPASLVIPARFSQRLPIFGFSFVNYSVRRNSTPPDDELLFNVRLIRADPFPCSDFVSLPGIADDRQPLIWLSALPHFLRVCQKTRWPLRSPANTSAGTRTKPAKPHTSGARWRKHLVGPPRLARENPLPAHFSCSAEAQFLT